MHEAIISFQMNSFGSGSILYPTYIVIVTACLFVCMYIIITFGMISFYVFFFLGTLLLELFHGHHSSIDSGSFFFFTERSNECMDETTCTMDRL